MPKKKGTPILGSRSWDKDFLLYIERGDLGNMTEGKIKKWRCTECGYLFEGPEPPDVCPDCLAPRSAFVEVEN